MSKQLLVHYVIIGILIIFSITLLVNSTNNKEELKTSEYKTDTTATITRQNNDILLYDREQSSNYFDYEKLIAGIVALGVAWLSLKATKQSDKQNKFQEETNSKIDKYQEENIRQHEEIRVILVTVTEQANKEKVIKELEDITKLITSLVEDNKCQILLESVGVRTCQFVMDVMTDELTPELYDFSLVKINSKCSEAIRQVKDMGFSKEFSIGFVKLQEKYTTALKESLHAILIENKVNHKYIRFGGAVKTFLKEYSRDIIKLHGAVEKV